MRKHLFMLLFAAAPIVATAQSSDAVVMTVNGKDITKSEFLYSYNKNNTEETVEKKSIDEYVELFKNFKLWIAEGETQKVDTSRAFRQELEKYREESAKPYLPELAADENLLHQEFDRKGEFVKVYHILVAFPGFPRTTKFLAADTAELYGKATDIMKKLSKKGVKFGDLVNEYSDDRGSAELGGFIGWFNGMNIAYPLEQAAFSIPVGKYGLARSNWGYHIIKVEEKIPHPGEYHAAHILVSCPKDADTVQVADAEAKIREIYTKAVGGVDFSELARDNSIDRGSAQNGGDLGWFEPQRMVEEFQTALTKMKEGEISKPFRTHYGFHIIKLYGKRPYEAKYEDEKANIEQSLNKIGYFVEAHRAGIEKMKKEEGFVKNESSYNKLIRQAATIFPTDSDYFDVFKNDTDVLFKIGDKPFTIADFIAFFKINYRSLLVLSTDIVADRLEIFEYQSLDKVRKENVENENPELKYLINEYRDGIILFEVKNKEIWEKASTDSAGLAQYFNDNRAKYAWDGARFKGYVVLAKDAKTKKEMQKAIKKMPADEAVEYLLENYKVGDVSYAQAEKGLFAKGDNAFVDEAIFKTGKAEYPENFSDFFLIGKTLSKPESVDDVKGQVITDYQDYLEEEWTAKLNAKYPVKINREVLDSLK
jgi:peptidyl-prolyl cis-trans isomerase SurA